MKGKSISCRTGISSTSGTMFKLIVCCLLAVLMFAGAANAQNTGENGDMEFDESTFDPDDQPVILPKGEMFEEGPAIADVIEGVGTIVYATVPVYTTPDKKSKIMRYAIPGEKVTITANNEEWFCVRMYNGKEGFVEKRNVKTMKVFYDESVTSNYMDKRLNVELHDLIDKFNATLNDSVYVRKFQIIPRLAMVTSAKRNNIITVTLEYSAVDINGTVIPSMQTNALSAKMRDFIELFFMKMLPSKATEYQIIIRKPVFSSTGQVLNTQGEYADIKVVHNDVPVNELKRQHGKVLGVAKCSMPMEQLFLKFPN